MIKKILVIFWWTWTIIFFQENIFLKSLLCDEAYFIMVHSIIISICY